MKLTLKRIEFKEDGIISHLLDENNHILAVTLEHSYDKKPKLYDGEFTCKRGKHSLHNSVPFETFEIMGVIGHTGILFHVGNRNYDSEGCVLLGKTFEDNIMGAMITESKITFNKFMTFLREVDEFQLTVSS